MAPKHGVPSSEADSAQPFKKQRKGFSVGPVNLPDGTYKRKVQKIKKDLVHKATVRRSYAKLKAREESDKAQNIHDEGLERDGQEENNEQGQDGAGSRNPPISLEPHPARQPQIDAPNDRPLSGPQEVEHHDASEPYHAREKRRKPAPFAREAQSAQKARDEADERRGQIERGRQERKQNWRSASGGEDRWRKQGPQVRVGNGSLGERARFCWEKVKKMMG